MTSLLECQLNSKKDQVTHKVIYLSIRELFEQVSIGVKLSWAPSVSTAHTPISKAYTSKTMVVIGLVDAELELKEMSALMR